MKRLLCVMELLAVAFSPARSIEQTVSPQQGAENVRARYTKYE